MSKIHNNTSEPCQNLESESGKSFQSAKKKGQKKRSSTYGPRGQTSMHDLLYFFEKTKIHR